MSIKGRLSQLERAIGKRATEPRESEDIERRWVREMPCWQLQVLARAEHWLSQNEPNDDWLSEGPPEDCFGGDGLRILVLYGLILRELRRQIEAGAVREDAPMAELLESAMSAGGLEAELRELVELLDRHGDPTKPNSPLSLSERDPLRFVKDHSTEMDGEQARAEAVLFDRVGRRE